MAKINVESGGTILSSGLLQLASGVAMSSTLTTVTDQNNNASPLKLSTTQVQTLSTLKITTADNPYIDAEDNSGNNRFTIGRDPSSQQVNLDFASKPTDLTTIVGSIRTYSNGINLSDTMTFAENGNVVARNKLTALIQLDVATQAGGGHAGAKFNDNGTLLRNGSYQIDNSTGNAGQLSNLAVGSTYVTTARLFIKGSGSTSATTSLLVQNSSGTAAVTVTDDLNTNFGGNLNLKNANTYINNTSNTIWIAAVQSATSDVQLIPGRQVNINNIGTYTAQGSALLQLDSTTKGFLPPRMTTAQKNAIGTPAAGLMVYDTTLNKLCVYTTAWETITSV
jgi:hypothetical protein